MGQSSLPVKNWREAGFKVDHTVPAEILGLLICDALQGLLRLHDRNGMCKALQIFGKTSLVRASMKPLRKRLGIACRKVQVSLVSCQLNHGLGAQHTVQMLVQK